MQFFYVHFLNFNWENEHVSILKDILLTRIKNFLQSSNFTYVINERKFEFKAQMNIKAHLNLLIDFFYAFLNGYKHLKWGTKNFFVLT